MLTCVALSLVRLSSFNQSNGHSVESAEQCGRLNAGPYHAAPLCPFALKRYLQCSPRRVWFCFHVSQSRLADFIFETAWAVYFSAYLNIEFSKSVSDSEVASGYLFVCLSARQWLGRGFRLSGFRVAWLAATNRLYHLWSADATKIVWSFTFFVCDILTNALTFWLYQNSTVTICQQRNCIKYANKTLARFMIFCIMYAIVTKNLFGTYFV